MEKSPKKRVNDEPREAKGDIPDKLDDPLRSDSDRIPRRATLFSDPNSEESTKTEPDPSRERIVKCRGIWI